jgi:hypothetical protein
MNLKIINPSIKKTDLKSVNPVFSNRIFIERESMQEDLVIVGVIYVLIRLK